MVKSLAFEAMLKEAQGCYSKVFAAVEDARASAKSNGKASKEPKVAKGAKPGPKKKAFAKV